MKNAAGVLVVAGLLGMSAGSGAFTQFDPSMREQARVEKERREREEVHRDHREERDRRDTFHDSTTPRHRSFPDGKKKEQHHAP